MNATARLDAAIIDLGGEAALLDRSGALLLTDHATLVVADLHLEKGSSFAMSGQFLPPYDSRATLSALAEVIARLSPQRVVALGDSFHDRTAHGRLDATDRDMLRGAMAGRDWLWVTGNHDPLPPTGLGGDLAAMAQIGRLRLVHEPTLMEGPEVAGHLHPAAKVRLRGRSVRCRCFATCGTRMILPAFGAFAGGLNLRDRTFRPFFPAIYTAHMIGQSRVFAVGKAMLLPD